MMIQRLIVLCVLSMMAFASLAFASPATESMADRQASTYTDNLADNVRPSVLAREIKKAQLDFYQAFNKVNQIDEFDIICKRRFNFSPNIKHKLCEPAYSRKLRLHNESMFTATAEHARIRAATRETNTDAITHFNQLVGKHPELQQRYSDVQTLLKRYEERTGRKPGRGLNWASLPFWGFTLEK